MSSLFRSFVRSKRKKKQTSSSTSADIPGKISNRSDHSRTTAHSHHCDQYNNLANKTRPQEHQFLRTSFTDDDDDKTDKHSTIRTTPSTDLEHNSKRRLFQSLRRKSKHDVQVHINTYTTNTFASRTPDTATASECSTPPSSTDELRKRYKSPPRPMKLNFELEESADYHNEAPQTVGPPHLPTTARTKHSDIPFLSDKTPSDLRKGTRKNQPVAQRNMSTSKNQSQTKTVIMNGDIVVCDSYNSRATSDTITIVSSASSTSKAKAIRRESERNARAAAALDDKGNALFEKGYFDKAMACYTKALKLKRRTFSHLIEETDDLEEELMLRDKNSSQTVENSHALVSMATSINNIGYLRQRSGDATPEETMAAYMKSLKIKRRILGNDSLSVGKTLNNIGSVHYLKREFDRALPAYEEALEIMKANLGEDHPDVATVMSNIGDVYLAQQKKDTSLRYYRLALTIRWEAFGGKSPRVIRLLEKISNLEIGDGMKPSGIVVNTKNPQWGDDVASELMVGSSYQPIAEELRELHEQMQKDIQDVEERERKATVDLLKDKIIIIRGMRDIGFEKEKTGPELLDNDSYSVVSALTARSRMSNLESR